MTSVIPLLTGAVSDLTLLAMHEQIIGEASLASDIFRCEMVTVGKRSLSGDTALVEPRQPLL
jgi:hypothetical protein